MIGSGLKKLARENGMSIASGVAYGNFRGYAATFSEGSGYKLLAVTTKFPDEPAENSFMGELHRRDLKKEYRVQELVMSDNCIFVNFYDSIGTMKYINSFCDLFFPLLVQYGASGVNFCPECGGEFFGDGNWKLINGAAYHLHESCAESIASGAAAQEQAVREADTGTIGAGIIGALLGALVGAIPWAFLLYMGYIAAVAGLLIGLLSKKGYELLHGKRCRAKLYIVIIASVLGVLIGNIAVDYYSLFSLIRDGLLPELTYGDIFPSLLYLFSSDDAYRAATLSNVGLGLLFALIGTYGVFRDIRRETAGMKMSTLK
ncbi:MAG: hypothetical protein ACI3VK_01875 [Oscillospiraceae bacterium]